jgi:hypothetical protein
MVAFGSGARANDPATQKPSVVGQSARCAQDRLTLLLYCAAIFLSLPCTVTADETWLPPSKLPLEVATGFFLANLSGAAERSETFEADLYLTFRWHDPRLAFTGTEPKRFLEEAAVEQLQTMWWPRSGFIETGTPGRQSDADIAPEDRSLISCPSPRPSGRTWTSGDSRLIVRRSRCAFSRLPGRAIR